MYHVTVFVNKLFSMGGGLLVKGSATAAQSSRAMQSMAVTQSLTSIPALKTKLSTHNGILRRDNSRIETKESIDFFDRTNEAFWVKKKKVGNNLRVVDGLFFQMFLTRKISKTLATQEFSFEVIGKKRIAKRLQLAKIFCHCGTILASLSTTILQQKKTI